MGPIVGNQQPFRESVTYLRHKKMKDESITVSAGLLSDFMPDGITGRYFNVDVVLSA